MQKKGEREREWRTIDESNRWIVADEACKGEASTVKWRMSGEYYSWPNVAMIGQLAN